MKADPAAQRRLLDLQVLDTTLTQLARRRETLSEITEVRDASAALETAQESQRQAEIQAKEIADHIAVLERDVSDVRTRIDRDRARMDAGNVPAKELESLGHEIDTLSARQSGMEDRELELMEEQETRDAVLSDSKEKYERAMAELADAESRRDQALAALDVEQAEQQTQRVTLVSQLPSDLLGAYEKAHAARSTGAALLRARRCGGCRLELSGTELAAARAAAADDVVHCEECDAILVRTEESGL